MAVRIGNTQPSEGHEYPCGKSIGAPLTEFEEDCLKMQVRIKGPGCGAGGIVLFGAHAKGELLIFDDPQCGKVGWTLEIEPNTSLASFLVEHIL